MEKTPASLAPLGVFPIVYVVTAHFLSPCAVVAAVVAAAAVVGAACGLSGAAAAVGAVEAAAASTPTSGG